MAGALGVFLIETDWTLVNTHSALLSFLCPLFLASQACPDCYSMSVFRRSRIRNLDGSALLPGIAISCREWRGRFLVCVATKHCRETT
jgi:hypothetical protein